MAEKMAQLLANNGLDVWWDRRLVARDDLNVVIEGELEKARSAIVLWSPHSVRSHWVRGEAQAALDLEKLVPIQIAECSPPINFRHLHTPQVFRSANQLSDLAKLLTDKLEGRHVPSSDPGPSQRKRTPPIATGTIVFEPDTVTTFLAQMKATTPRPGETFSERRAKSLALWKQYPIRTTLFLVVAVVVALALNYALDAASLPADVKSAIEWLVIISGAAYFYFIWPRRGWGARHNDCRLRRALGPVKNGPARGPSFLQLVEVARIELDNSSL